MNWTRILAALALALALFAAAAVVRAAPPVASLEGARRIEAVGRHDAAADALERVIASEGFSPDVLIELGNAHHRAGRTGHAILAWERARLLEPNDPDVNSNLDLARSRASLAAPAEGSIESIARALPARSWLAIGGASLLLFVLGALAFPVVRRGRAAITAATVASALVVAASAGALWIGTLGTERAVLVADGSATLRLSPFEDAEPVTTLAEGELVSLEGIHEGWVRVADPAGRSGWVARDAIERLVPRAADR